MASKAEKGGGQTSRDYTRGQKGAAKAMEFKPTAQKKGQYNKISGQLAKKSKAGDKSAAGAGSTFSRARQDKAAAGRGKGAPTTSSGATAPRNQKAGQKAVQKGMVDVIKANKYKPKANKIENSKYNKLEKVVKSRQASAAKSGNAKKEARQAGVLKGISVLRQDAAAARRGSGSQPRKALSASSRQDAAAASRGGTKPITAVKKPVKSIGAPQSHYGPRPMNTPLKKPSGKIAGK